VLEGDLGTFLPSEVLQFLQLCAATGRLELERAGESAELYLEDGHPMLGRTSRGSVRLGEILLHRGALDVESLERALALQQNRPSERLGALLVRSGTAPRDQVERAVEEGLKRILFGIMLWKDGRFRFLSGERTEIGELRPEVELDQLILEGLRQADEVRSSG
jgi:hypothetical protein